MRNIARRLILALTNVDEVYLINEKKYHLSDTELYLMYALDDNKPHSQKEISSKFLIPKTTLNTLTKKWEKEGLLIQIPIPGKRREMQISLTNTGKNRAKDVLSFIYDIEEKALKKTLEKYSEEFIDAIEFFGTCLKEEFEKHPPKI